MYIMVTQDSNFDKRINNIITVQVSEEVVQAYGLSWKHRRERTYKVRVHHMEYIATCIELRDDKAGLSALFIPEFLIPGRPYPVYVYLYSISLYCSESGMSQRAAAEATRQYFDLETFAHTTLGRALKAFVRKLEEVNEKEGDEKEGDNTEGTESDNGGVAVVRQGIPSKQLTESLRRRAMATLPIGLVLQTRQVLINACYRLARARYREYQSFLL